MTLRPDLLLVINTTVFVFVVVFLSTSSTFPGVPVGAVKVMFPEKDIMHDETFAGQLYDCLRMLHDIFNVKQPFGIMTTYEEWRFCWFPRRTTRFAKEEKTRELASSKIFKHDSVLLPLALMFVLEQMSLAAPEKTLIRPTFGEHHLFICKDQRVTWRKFEVDLQDGFPDTTSNGFFLFGYLGAGAQGKVWRACNQHTVNGIKVGALCAVKLYTPASRDQTMDDLREEIRKEIEIWNTVFGDYRPFQLKLARSPALVMPVLEQPETWGEDHIKAAREAVTKYSKHSSPEDLKRSHVGIYTVQNVLTAILFDTKPGDTTQDTLQEMMKSLQL